MNFLTLETTCDETAAAIVTDQLTVLSSVVASQEELHEKFNGVVPEIAARAHVERILPVIQETLSRANLKLNDLSAIAVANQPGLSGSLLIGLSAAKALAYSAGLPLIGINHLHAHVYACKIAAQQEIFPCLGFVVSGGHTNLFQCENAISFEHLGGTIDDAAGEAFDKVATMLGFPYPGGPHVSAAASNGNRKAYRFPRAFLSEPDRLQFSFSGLKTAVLYQLLGPGNSDVSKIKIDDQTRSDVAASFEAAVVDCLVGKAFHAIQKTGLRRICVGGGVAANRFLRSEFASRCAQEGVELHIAPMELCTDNAVMGAIAVEKFQAGLFEDLDLDVVAGLVR
ncbi:MAG: tRNA (adenosine(37)-N6)-threonylcarbamoyltransferase complex transferase subunit TsaD [Planctomycetota bacterium]|nr:tRNA (adenosine(37)-N6)-threonylcarbamoyltransferase complex transferase subunit TsaD [Planctomycetota bacterium]